ncbi:hypothetical protein MSG28_011342 [Choristoneura fumiferana]|uniref:Uncharacterized protein n=1 Tax=Choristoneura fumiferana TaxID=7141 RepID=A0ACC0JN13_CHOFU|nr:hypothetical protein MSG28_011342 [Choristoneura fumiferana]
MDAQKKTEKETSAENRTQGNYGSAAPDPARRLTVAFGPDSSQLRHLRVQQRSESHTVFEVLQPSPRGFNIVRVKVLSNWGTRCTRVSTASGFTRPASRPDPEKLDCF